MKHLDNASCLSNRVVRLSTIEKADVILVIKNGTILEQGSPSELLKPNSDFFKLCKTRFDIVDDASHDIPIAKTDLSHGSPDATYINRQRSQRSGSSFRADAPAFVPRRQSMSEASSQRLFKDHLTTNNHQDPKRAVSSPQGRSFFTPPNGRSLDKNVNSRRQNMGPKTSNKPKSKMEPAKTNVNPVAADNKFGTGGGEQFSSYQPTPRLNRWQRRRQARSDPTNSAIGPDRTNNTSGDHVSDKTASTTTSRCVSGPGMYPVGARPSALSDQRPNKRAQPIQKSIKKKKPQKHLKKGGQADSDVMATPSESKPHDEKTPRTPPSTEHRQHKDLVDENVNPLARSSGAVIDNNVHFAPEA